MHMNLTFNIQQRSIVHDLFIFTVCLGGQQRDYTETRLGMTADVDKSGHNTVAAVCKESSIRDFT